MVCERYLWRPNICTRDIDQNGVGLPSLRLFLKKLNRYLRKEIQGSNHRWFRLIRPTDRIVSENYKYCLPAMREGNLKHMWDHIQIRIAVKICLWNSVWTLVGSYADTSCNKNKFLKFSFRFKMYRWYSLNFSHCRR